MQCVANRSESNSQLDPRLSYPDSVGAKLLSDISAPADVKSEYLHVAQQW